MTKVSQSYGPGSEKGRWNSCGGRQYRWYEEMKQVSRLGRAFAGMAGHHKKRKG